MENQREKSGAKKNILLIVGLAAIFIAIVFYIAIQPRAPKVDPYVLQLEGEVAIYTSHIDSLNTVVDGLNGRLNTIRTKMDSAQVANRTLLASLQKVSHEMKEYRGLYRKQQALNKKLVKELSHVKSEMAEERVEKERATREVRGLKAEVDSLNNEIFEQTIRLVRLEQNLEESMKETASIKDAVTSVLVFVGTEKSLKEAGYLKAGRSVFFKKNYKAIGFPDISDEKGKDAVLRIPVGVKLALMGEVAAIADRHGKLDKGKEYHLQKIEGGQSLVTFVDSTLQGQRVLAVLKNKK